MDSIKRILKSRYTFIVFCLVVAFGLFGISGGLFETPLAKALWNLNHLIAFFSGSLLLFYVFPTTRPAGVVKTVKFVAFILIISILIEAIQSVVGRDASVQDIALNLAGSLFAVILNLLLVKEKIPGRVWLSGILLVISITLFWPSLRVLISEFHNYMQFPTLADFSRDVAIEQWSGGDSELKITRSAELEVRFHAGKDYARVVYESFYGKWEKYKELVIKIRNPDAEQLKITVRLHDRLHKFSGYRSSDRFYRSFKLVPGMNNIMIPVLDIYHAPVSRLMKLDQLERLIIFTSDLSRDRNIYINKIYLR